MEPRGCIQADTVVKNDCEKNLWNSNVRILTQIWIQLLTAIFFVTIYVQNEIFSNFRSLIYNTYYILKWPRIWKKFHFEVKQLKKYISTNRMVMKKITLHFLFFEIRIHHIVIYLVHLILAKIRIMNLFTTK